MTISINGQPVSYEEYLEIDFCQNSTNEIVTVEDVESDNDI